MTRLPRRLDPATFHEVERLYPSRYSVTINRRQASSGELSVVREMSPALAMHDFVELFTPKGSAGIFRVTNVDDNAPTLTSFSLLHAIDTLSDSVVALQTDYDGTIPDYLTKLLAHQKRVYWQLGTCAATGAWKRKGINYDSVADLFWQLVEELYDYYLTFDFTTSPWTLNILEAPSGVRSEFRLSKNINRCNIRRSDGDMCTRLYCSINTQSTTDKVTKNTVEIKTYDNAAAQAVYGIIEKTADIDTGDVPDPDAWAAEYLARRAQPAVQITIDGQELGAISGDDWDEHDIATLCRVALPSIREVLTERVESVAYPDLITRDTSLTVQLSTRLAKVSENIASIAKQARNAGRSARGAARGGASAAEMEYWAQVVKKAGVETLAETGIVIDATTGAKIYSLSQGFVSQYSELKVQSNKISMVVSTDSEGENHVKAASIVAAINSSGSSVIIKADKINLEGYVTASQLSVTNARITNILNGSITASKLSASSASLGNSHSTNVSIYGQTVRVFAVTDNYGTTRQVFGYTL